MVIGLKRSLHSPRLWRSTVGMAMMGMILSEAILTSLEELAPQDDMLGWGRDDPDTVILPYGTGKWG